MFGSCHYFLGLFGVILFIFFLTFSENYSLWGPCQELNETEKCLYSFLMMVRTVSTNL